jgi:hypothetical protein
MTTETCTQEKRDADLLAAAIRADNKIVFDMLTKSILPDDAVWCSAALAANGYYARALLANSTPTFEDMEGIICMGSGNGARALQNLIDAGLPLTSNAFTRGMGGMLMIVATRLQGVDIVYLLSRAGVEISEHDMREYHELCERKAREDNERRDGIPF